MRAKLRTGPRGAAWGQPGRTLSLADGGREALGSRHGRGRRRPGGCGPAGAGATTGNEDGAQRIASTETWKTASEWLRSELDGIEGVTVETDEAGNPWAHAPGTPTIRIVGGHLDSVPDGGWLDGALTSSPASRCCARCGRDAAG